MPSSREITRHQAPATVHPPPGAGDRSPAADSKYTPATRLPYLRVLAVQRRDSGVEGNPHGGRLKGYRRPQPSCHRRAPNCAVTGTRPGSKPAFLGLRSRSFRAKSPKIRDRRHLGCVGPAAHGVSSGPPGSPGRKFARPGHLLLPPRFVLPQSSWPAHEAPQHVRAAGQAVARRVKPARGARRSGMAQPAPVCISPRHIQASIHL